MKKKKLFQPQKDRNTKITKPFEQQKSVEREIEQTDEERREVRVKWKSKR